MRIDQRFTPIRAAVLAGLAVGALLLGGCSAAPPSEPSDPPASNETSPDPQSEEQPGGEELTCEEFASVIEESLPLMFVMFDTEGNGNAGEVADAFRTISDMWSGFTPPAEIADDWPALTDWADAYAVAWEEMPADAGIQDSYDQISAEFEEEDAAYDAAMEEVTAYVDAECPQG